MSDYAPGVLTDVHGYGPDVDGGRQRSSMCSDTGPMRDEYEAYVTGIQVTPSHMRNRRREIHRFQQLFRTDTFANGTGKKQNPQVDR